MKCLPVCVIVIQTNYITDNKSNIIQYFRAPALATTVQEQLDHGVLKIYTGTSVCDIYLPYVSVLIQILGVIHSVYVILL